MQFFKRYILSSFQTQWKRLLILSVPAILLGIFGLHQLGQLTLTNAVALSLTKGLCEFFFIGLGLAVLNLLRVKISGSCLWSGSCIISP